MHNEELHTTFSSFNEFNLVIISEKSKRGVEYNTEVNK
jgi:hypothetical protein